MPNATAPVADVDRAAIDQAYQDLLDDWIDRDTLELLLATDYGYDPEMLPRISTADVWAHALSENLVTRQQVDVARRTLSADAWEHRPA